MVWTQVLNDVTSRISAASQNLSTSDPLHSSYSAGVQAGPPYGDQACESDKDSQSSSMSVRLQLDDQDVPYYTNLDFVSGTVHLSLSNDTSIAAINVKLEGESRTRLQGPVIPTDPAAGQKVNTEVHKLLYKMQTVFPGTGLTQDGSNARFTLPPGQYTYRFALKIPFNNDCVNNTRLFQDLKRGRFLGPEVVGAHHVKQTLPPTLGGIPGQAETRYFVKVTVVRPKFYQENLRSQVNIRFQPIEPPRPPFRNEETYARRQHQFQAVAAPVKKGGFFKKAQPVQIEELPLSVKVEARLPNPTIIYCQQPLPLRVMVEKTNESSASVYLSLLQIELIGFTNVRAQGLSRTETGSWVIMSLANMQLPLDNPTDKSTRSFSIPSRYWDTLPLPDTVTPTFNTCNISRRYELEIRVGLSHGMADGVRPELVVLPLRIPVEVYSGIKPPEKLLARINTQTPNHVKVQQPLASNLVPPGSSNISYQPSPITPLQNLPPPQAGTYMAPPLDDPNDLPPSYEDAMADDIAPVDGPRRDYTGSSAASTVPPLPFKPDLKNSSGLNRHGSERLFSQNAPSAPFVGGSPLSSGRTRGQTANTDTAGVTDSLAHNMNNISTVTQNNPPPLPARKGTTDSTMNQKR